MVQRAELVNFASPRPYIIIQIITPLVRVVEADFYLYGVFVFFRVLDNARYQGETVCLFCDKLVLEFCHVRNVDGYVTDL